jgi:hypothetical protein
MLTAISTRGNGLTIRHTVSEPINMPTALHMSENGTRINNMAKELKNGQMVQSTKDTTSTEKNTAMVN